MPEPEYPSDEWQKAYMRRLAADIREWKRQYYYGLPTVDDAQYDLWWRNLLVLEGRYPHLKDPSSPTINPGAPLPERKMTLAEMAAPRRLSMAELQATL